MPSLISLIRYTGPKDKGNLLLIASTTNVKEEEEEKQTASGKETIYTVTS